MLILLSVTTVHVLAQAYQNPQIDAFMDYLSENGAKVSVSRVNDKYHVAKRYNVAFDKESVMKSGEKLGETGRVPQIVDSICLFFDQMIRHSIESYRYESHKNGNDTITYSMAIKGYGTNGDYLLDNTRYESAAFSWTNDYNDFMRSHVFLYKNAFYKQEMDFYALLNGKNRKMYFGAKEAGLFDYTNGLGNMIYISNYENEAQGTYYNFDISPVDDALKKILKKDGSIKRFSVKYVHGMEESNDKTTTYYATDYLAPDLKGQSESTGELYVIPASEGGRAKFKEVLDVANHHLDTHLTECCVLEYTKDRLILNGIKSTMKLQVNHQPLSATLLAKVDQEGNLYILRLDTEGEYWIPRDWHQIKSSIHGKNSLVK